MIPLLCLSILSFFPIIDSVDCICKSCPVGLCTGDYCYMKQYYPYSDDDPITGCLTPREDAWRDAQVPLCERDLMNTSTLCLCNKDRCNTPETFAAIHSNGSYTEQKLIECVNKKNFVDPDYPDHEDKPPFNCQSSFCVSEERRLYNSFRDLEKAPFSEVYRKCYYNDQYNTFRIDLTSSMPQMNSCMHIRWDQKSSLLICVCNTPNCNENIPMYNITRRGKGICYLKTAETETSTCWGDYCYWTEYGRGCLDAAGADENFKLRLGESSYDTGYMVICEGSYCNSDILYPNGTIVGPSATRRFSTNSFTQLSLTTAFLLALAAFFP